MKSIQTIDEKHTEILNQFQDKESTKINKHLLRCIYYYKTSSQRSAWGISDLVNSSIASSQLLKAIK